MKPLLIGLLCVGLLSVPCWMAAKKAIGKPKQQKVDSAVYYHQGRDAAILELLAMARKSVFVKTDSIEMTEVATALARLVQGGASVILEVPSHAPSRQRDGALLQAIAHAGIACHIGKEQPEGYRGALIVVDGEKMLYSASPLSYAPMGSSRPYVLGKVKHDAELTMLNSQL